MCKILNKPLFKISLKKCLICCIPSKFLYCSSLVRSRRGERRTVLPPVIDVSFDHVRHRISGVDVTWRSNVPKVNVTRKRFGATSSFRGGSRLEHTPVCNVDVALSFL